MVRVICAAGAAGGALCIGLGDLQATSIHSTASVGATISSAGGVGAVVAAPATTTPTTATGSTIRSVPVSTTSNIGFSSPAPASDLAASGAPDDTTGSTQSPAATTRAFASRGARQVSLGPSAAVSVAGSPNQTYTVILPGKTAYVRDGEVVSLSDFQHNAGTTPAVGNNGAGVFTIGAKSETAPVEAAGTNTAPATKSEDAIASAFTRKSPIVNIAVTYN